MRSIDSSYNIKYSELERIRNRSQQEHNTLVDGVKNNREQNKEISGIFCQDNLISNIVAMSYIKNGNKTLMPTLEKKKLQKNLFCQFVVDNSNYGGRYSTYHNKTLDKEGML